jgi:hypothetical protein
MSFQVHLPVVEGRPRRRFAGPSTGEAACPGFHHRLERATAVRALLLNVGADGGEVSSLRVQGQQGIVVFTTKGGAAGPGEAGGFVGHAGAHGLEGMQRSR